MNTKKYTWDKESIRGLIILIGFVVSISAVPIHYALTTFDTYTETSRESFNVTGFGSDNRKPYFEFLYEGKKCRTAVDRETSNNVTIGDIVVCDVEKFYKNKTGEYTKTVFKFVELRKK